MIKHFVAITVGLVATTALASSDHKAQAKVDALSGGKTTVFNTSVSAFSLPAKNLGLLRRDSFFMGNAFFKQPWVTAPASTSLRDGLGPLFNSNTCQSCHIKDGKGKPPINAQDKFVSALIRLSIPATTDQQKQQQRMIGVVPEPNYGDQFQPHAIRGVEGEGNAQLSYHTLKGQFSDGKPYSLQTPSLVFNKLNYGAMHDKVMTSIRVAPAMIGLGLLENIPEQDILALADADDSNNDGISGRPNQVWSVEQQKAVLGRFGWKANQPDIKQQSAGAFLGDMGLTSRLFPDENCQPQQINCQKAPHGGQPEVDNEVLDKVVFYASMLAVPARRHTEKVEVQRGEKLFRQANCNACHTETFKTGTSNDFPELSQQTIHPYTDLLLHDMGEGLADNRPDFLATGREWRTAPLWGIGLVETVNGHTRFLHDGRARSLLEAVLWHGGEAKASQQAVLDMRETDRQALIAFLKSL